MAIEEATESRSERCSITHTEIPRTARSNLKHASKTINPEQTTAWVSEAMTFWWNCPSYMSMYYSLLSASFINRSRMILTQTANGPAQSDCGLLLDLLHRGLQYQLSLKPPSQEYPELYLRRASKCDWMERASSPGCCYRKEGWKPTSVAEWKCSRYLQVSHSKLNSIVYFLLQHVQTYGIVTTK